MNVYILKIRVYEQILYAKPVPKPPLHIEARLKLFEKENLGGKSATTIQRH